MFKHRGLALDEVIATVIYITLAFLSPSSTSQVAFHCEGHHVGAPWHHDTRHRFSTIISIHHSIDLPLFRAVPPEQGNMSSSVQELVPLTFSDCWDIG